MSFARIQHRLLTGRPLAVDSDTCAAFRARGVSLDTPGAIGVLLRERPADVAAHYRAEVMSRVDVLCALTADTTPRALAEAGMEHRSAVLTRNAVELAFEAASTAGRAIAVAGVLGSEMVGPVAVRRQQAELNQHAERLAAAGCELILARGQGSHLGLMTAITAAARTELPTWAVVECAPTGELLANEPVLPLMEALEHAGASAILFEVPSIDAAITELERVRAAESDAAPGVLLAGGPKSVRGFPDLEANPVHWAQRALELDAHGARIIGGGAGTTEAHTAALALELGLLHPSIPVRSY